MYKLNRKTRYQIIKEIVKKTDPETLNKLVNDLWGEDSIDNTEKRREEILEYLEEMNDLWNDKNIDMTDRQYLVVKPVDYEKIERETKEAAVRQACFEAELNKSIDEIIEKEETKEEPVTFVRKIKNRFKKN